MTMIQEREIMSSKTYCNKIQGKVQGRCEYQQTKRKQEQARKKTSANDIDSTIDD
jgi:hypothetical protein